MMVVSDLAIKKIMFVDLIFCVSPRYFPTRCFHTYVCPFKIFDELPFLFSSIHVVPFYISCMIMTFLCHTLATVGIFYPYNALKTLI